MKATASDTLYLSHRNRLLGLACHRGCDAHEAEDALHDLFAKLLRSGRMDEVTALPYEDQCAILSRRLLSTMMNRHRAQMAQRRSSARTVALADVMEEAPFCSQSTPATALERSWAMAALHAALQRLQAEMTLTEWHLVSPYLDADNARRPAAASTPKVRVAVYRARQRLRALISPEELRASLLAA